jgi:hypothetical protein
MYEVIKKHVCDFLIQNVDDELCEYRVFHFIDDLKDEIAWNVHGDIHEIKP